MLLDTDTPVSAFAKVRRGPFAFLLESAPAGSETWSRYTYMGTEPRRAWRLLRDGSVDDWTPGRGWHATRRPADPLADLQHHIAQDVPASVPELGDFWTGAIGYFGYDVVRYIERLPHPSAAGLDVPDAVFVFTKCVVIIDNLRAQARVVAGVTVPAGADDATLRRLYDEAAAMSMRCSPGSTLPCPCPRSISTRPRRPPRDARRTSAHDFSPMSRAFASTSSRETASRRSSRAGSMCRTTSSPQRSIGPSARSIHRRTCTIWCSMGSSSWAACPSCWSGSPTAASPCARSLAPAAAATRPPRMPRSARSCSPTRRSGPST